MSSDPAGRLVVISGPSGSGKSTLWRRLLAGHPGLEFSVSATTRPARPGEVDGRDYHFLTAGEFERRAGAGEFLEHARVHGFRYGTLRAQVEEALARGRDILLEIDVQGAAQVRGAGLPTVFLFVMPPSLEVLEERLRNRASEGEEQVQRRLSIARTEMKQAADYDHVVVNDDLDALVARVEEVLGLEKVP